MRLSQALKELSSELDRQKIPLILIGGFAVNYYGGSRLTTDIDFLLDQTNFEKTALLLKERGFDLTTKNNLFARFKKEDLAIKALDLIFVDEETFKKIHRDSQEIVMAGVSLRVPSILHLIALKLHALKDPNEGRKGKDLTDILELVKKGNINPRSEDFKQHCLTYGSEEIHKKILSLV